MLLVFICIRSHWNLSFQSPLLVIFIYLHFLIRSKDVQSNLYSVLSLCFILQMFSFNELTFLVCVSKKNLNYHPKLVDENYPFSF